MNIAIVGTGYVGLVTGTCFSEFGVTVTCVDKDEKKIKMLRQAQIPFFEPGLSEMVQRNMEQERLKFTTSIAEAVKEALVVFIAVGTPPRGDGSADLQYVEQVAEEIAQTMDGYKVIVTKSTVPVGTGEKIRQIISEHCQGKMDFDVVSNPEFLREGSAIEDFMRPNRVVIGARSQQAIAIMKDLYRPLYLLETPFVITDVETSELIKYASNSFLATKISFINEMAVLCDQVGADVNVVSKGMGLDGRIGAKFLHPGPGFGGSCFPKDTKALLTIGRERGVELSVVNAAIEANDRQMQYALGKVTDNLAELAGKTVAILGLSFKPNTDDIRESPALTVIEQLKAKGAAIRAYDPAAMENAKQLLPDIQYCEDAYDACQGADALVIVTEWNQFRNLDLEKIKQLLKQPYLFDFRNIYDSATMKNEGFHYFSIGRP